MTTDSGELKRPTRYVLHPGYITSAHDGQDHFIGGPRLARLYGVDIKQCVWIDRDYFPQTGDIHLIPREDGDYRIPAEDLK